MDASASFHARCEIYSMIVAGALINERRLLLRQIDAQKVKQSLDNFFNIEGAKEYFGLGDKGDYAVTEALMGYALRHHKQNSLTSGKKYLPFKKEVQDVIDKNPELVGMKRDKNGDLEFTKPFQAQGKRPEAGQQGLSKHL